MAIHDIDGVTGADKRIERTNAGTIGQDQIIPRSLAGANNAVIDDADPRIQYGAITAEGGVSPSSFQLTRQTSYDYSGTSTAITQNATGFSCLFTGTSIGVLGRMGINSSQLHVYIDGVLTPGRVLSTTSLASNYATPTTPLNATDTTIYITAPFTSGGTTITAGLFMIDSEVISYTGYDATNVAFTGCTRGSNGTRAATHSWTSMIYAYSSTVPLNFGPTLPPSFSDEQVVYYNPFLSPGTHRITVAVLTDPNTGPVGNVYFGFDGLIVGPLLGARNLLRSIGSVIIGPVTTNGAGYVDLGTLNTRTGVSIVGFMGYNLISGPSAPLIYCLADGGSVNATTGMTMGGDSPMYRLIGNATATYTVQLIFSYIGETL